MRHRPLFSTLFLSLSAVLLIQAVPPHGALSEDAFEESAPPTAQTPPAAAEPPKPAEQPPAP